VRRLEALTGRAARKAANATMQAAQQIANDLLRVSVADMPGRITQLLDERKKLERDLAEAKKKLAMGGAAASGDDGIRTVGNVKLLARAVSGIVIKDLKGLADEGKKQVGSGIVALVATSEDGKGSIVVGVTPDLVSRFSAIDLVRKASAVLGGKGGGGKPDMAQAGGPDGSKADAALKAIEAALSAASPDART
jgi:alanyl-tRNA synthetase